EAAEQAGNVVFAATAKVETNIIINEDGSYTYDPYAVTLYEKPFDALCEVSDFAHINSMPDSDGVTRRYIKYFDLPQDVAAQVGINKSLSFADTILSKYNEYYGMEDEANPPLDSQHMWEIPFTVEPGGYGSGFSFIDVLEGNIDPAVFAGRIVLIGPYATGMQDAYRTAISPVPMHGVEIHANAISALMMNIYRMEVPQYVQLAMIFVTIFIFYFVFRAFNILLSTVIAGVLVSGYLWIVSCLSNPPDSLWDTLLFDVNGSQVRLLLSPTYFVAAIVVLFVGVVANNFIVEKKRRDALSSVFKKYLDPRVVERMNEEGFNLQSLSSKRIHASVMFVDIRGFTPFSEPLEPEEVVEMLKDYLTLTSEAVYKYDGFLDKFIGDATMAVFNAPLPQEDYEYKSVLSAWDIAYFGLLKIPAQMEKYGRSVSPGIGLNLGSLIFGNIGSEARKDLTVIGDTVNTAARFESVARPGQILMNDELYEALKDRIIVRYHGEMQLKGKAVQPKIYALEQVVEYIGKYPPLASAAVPPGKTDLPKGFDFTAPPRLMPENLDAELMKTHLTQCNSQIEGLKKEYDV
ncbi:MAG: adenylate/guanylate cyclase domain-containing protein, partial [Anaerotignaceae bacterium]